MDFEKQRQIMVDSQIRVNDVTSPAIVAAFLDVPRESFLPKSLQSSAYAEFELPVREGRSMWIPRDLAKLLKAMEPAAGNVALVVGAANGYSSAVLGKIVDTVIALEDNADVIEEMSERFADIGLDNVIAVEGNLANGLADQGPFDLIMVGGMVETIAPAWLDQLSEGGRLGVVVATGRGIGQARVYTRAGSTVSHRDVFECCPPVLPGFEKKAAFVF